MVDTELEKCLHGKTQNANERFIGTIWECIPQNTVVPLHLHYLLF